jgi:hypothetical protein
MLCNQFCLFRPTRGLTLKSSSHLFDCILKIQPCEQKCHRNDRVFGSNIYVVNKSWIQIESACEVVILDPVVEVKENCLEDPRLPVEYV